MADTPVSSMLADALAPTPTTNQPMLPSGGVAGRDPGITFDPPAPIETLDPLVPPPGATPPPNLLVNSQNAVQSVQENSARARANLAYQEAATRNSGRGAGAPQTQEQRDLDTMSPAQLRERYGTRRAFQLLADRTQAEANYVNDSTARRGTEAMLGDSAVTAGGAFLSGIGNIASFGAGLVSYDAGTWSAQRVQDFNDYIQGIQTPAAQARARASQARGTQQEADNTVRFEQDVSNDVPRWEAHLRRIARGAVASTVDTLTDPVSLTQGIASGVGSIFTAGPIAKGLALLGSRLLPAAARVPAAIGLLEGGGAYQQAVQEVMQMDPGKLSENSPAFREMLAAGRSVEEARRVIANDAGLLAGAVQAPVAALTGTLVSRFEGAPLHVPNVRTAAGNLIRETVEEGGQNATGQVAQNLGVQTFADQTQSLSEGVGE